MPGLRPQQRLAARRRPHHVRRLRLPDLGDRGHELREAGGETLLRERPQHLFKPRRVRVLARELPRAGEAGDVGEILGGEALGVAATSSIDEVLALDADCVVYSPLIPNDDEVVAILRSGKNVVTPVGWVYPDLSSPAVAASGLAQISKELRLMRAVLEDPARHSSTV